jgi:uncharacterized protein YfaS (alpha-2-macroglobulin family)
MEQTSSTAYPNVLVVDYLKQARRAKPEMMMKASQYLSVGYQKILTFQNPNGGFGWWAGGDNPVVWVTAYGVQELSDMGKVMEVDSNVIKRAQDWLVAQQSKDGAWRIPGQTHGVAIERMEKPEIGLTGYVAWTLAETGFKGKALENALTFLKDHLDDAAGNPYALALTACALAAAEPEAATTKAVLRTLDGLKKEKGETVYWGTDGQTLSYARGDSATVEITALVVYSMQKAGGFVPTVNKGLAYLVAARGSGGGWGSTQATILALKALVRGMGGQKQEGDVVLNVTLNGQGQTLKVTPDQSDVLQLVDLKSMTRPGANRLEIGVEGKSGMMYQVVARHYVPWELAGPADRPGPLSVDVTYDRAQLKTGDVLRADVALQYTGPVTTYMVIVDLGLPPGFVLDTSAFEKLVEQKVIEKFSATSRQVTIYLGGLKTNQSISFSYTLMAKHPIRAKTPKTTAYEYYTPENRAVAKPVTIEVGE